MYILVCLSPFHAPECLLSQFYLCINDTVAYGWNFIYNTFENDYYQENEVCFIALIGNDCYQENEVCFIALIENEYYQETEVCFIAFN